MVLEMLSSWRWRFGGRSSRGLGTQYLGVSCGVYGLLAISVLFLTDQRKKKVFRSYPFPPKLLKI